MFKGIKDTWKKSEAAVVVQGLFEDLKGLGVGDHAAKLANSLVEKGWSTTPEYFDGRFGVRPHKVSIAATCLALGVENTPEDSELYTLLLCALGKLMVELEPRSFLLNLTPLDGRLLGSARDVLIRHSERQANSELGKELGGMIDRQSDH